jgi:probable rRNA maturation factor
VFFKFESLPENSHKIEIADEQTHPFESESLIAAVEMILNKHGFQRSEVSIAVVDDPTIRRLNKEYLNHDYETDVISFVLDSENSTDPSKPKQLTGQLIVSTDTAGRLAAELGGSLQEELLLYVVHGTLHLVGLDDQTDELAEEMRKSEKEILSEFGVIHRWDSESVSQRKESSE